MKVHERSKITVMNFRSSIMQYSRSSWITGEQGFIKCNFEIHCDNCRFACKKIGVHCNCSLQLQNSKCHGRKKCKYR